ncbi:archaetidylserine decarboxylase [Desmospora profundinema]|uniref:Phosphatidylserine decarboxylase proenzyme n=1 Tax=Desmospora profundinema TaxID=1571184 RepID=A0ABU1IKC8_9BACL|nr:archaetidylserine decarboxylase [Desmospora profundinema]MDR6225245.1 phosphatidylserine decarboxylase [Desmospora profundinema]
MKENLFLSALHVLPKRTLSRLMGSFARSPLSRRLIPFYIRRFDVDLSQVEKPASQYESLMEFFVRGLKEGARPVDPDPRMVVSPVDGTVSQAGTVEEDTLIQAKGVQYSLEALLGGAGTDVDSFRGGSYLTVYLSPRDYHRIHTPVAGRVTHLTWIPGTLFPVNEMGVRRIPGLFTRNERLITYMETKAGRMALVKVGATNVGSIRVSYDPDILTNRRGKKSPVRREYREIAVWEKGEEMGRFEFGSTVILLFQARSVQWLEPIRPGGRVQMGQPIGQLIDVPES